MQDVTQLNRIGHRLGVAVGPSVGRPAGSMLVLVGGPVDLGEAAAEQVAAMGIQ